MSHDAAQRSTLDRVVTPAEALRRLQRAEASGELGGLAERHGLRLVVVFGSAGRGDADARDLDVAVAARDERIDAQ